MRQFKRVEKQVGDRRSRLARRGGPFVLLHDLIVYCLEVKAFHVKQFGKVDAALLSESEKEFLAAGEELEERCKSWLEGG